MFVFLSSLITKKCFTPVPLDHRNTHPSWVNSFSIPLFTDGVFHSSSWSSDKFSSTAMCQTTSLNQDWHQNYTAGSIVSCTDIFLSVRSDDCNDCCQRFDVRLGCVQFLPEKCGSIASDQRFS
jgi:hypothetical protein